MSKKLLVIVMTTMILASSVLCNLGGVESTPPADSVSINGGTGAPPAPQPAPDREQPPPSTPTPTRAPTPTATPTDEPIPAVLTGAEAYEYAFARAKRWQADAELVGLSTTQISPLDSNGESESWSAQFWSPSAQAINTITLSNGKVNTSVSAADQPRTVNPNSILFKTKDLFTLAEASGGQQYLDLGYVAAARLAPYPLDPYQPVWFIHYRHPQQQRDLFRVIIEGSSGQVIQATRLGELTPVN